MVRKTFTFILSIFSCQYEPLARMKRLHSLCPPCPGLKNTQTAQTSSPSRGQLQPAAIVVTTNDWQPVSCQSQCDLWRPHCPLGWEMVWSTEYLFCPFNVIIMTWNTGHMTVMICNIINTEQIVSMKIYSDQLCFSKSCFCSKIVVKRLNSSTASGSGMQLDLHAQGIK